MNDILFRGKSNLSKEPYWVEGYFFKIGDRYYIVDQRCDTFAQKYFTPVDPNTIGQWTGLTDCNCKKIFDGDVVVINESIQMSYVVTMRNFKWVLVNDLLGEGFYHELENNSERYKVVSNIHDIKNTLDNE